MSFSQILYVRGIYSLEMKPFTSQKASITYCCIFHLPSVANFSHPLPFASVHLEEAASANLL